MQDQFGDRGGSNTRSGLRAPRGWSSDSQTVLGRLVHHARSQGDQPAIIVLKGDATTTLSWDGLLRASVGYARRFEAEGVRRGDTVLLCMAHGPSLFPAFLGAMLVGAVPGYLAIPSEKQDPTLYWASHEALLERIQPRVLLTSIDVPSVVGGTRVVVDEPIEAPQGSVTELIAPYSDTEPAAVALLQHSSGTTGLKKGVALTHDQIAAQVKSLAARLDLGDADRVASWLPVYHDMGLISSFLVPVHLGLSVVSIDAFEWVNEPHLLLEVMDAHQATLTWLPNFAFNHLVRTRTGDESYRLDHVRAFINCSEPCKSETFDRFAEAFAGHGVRRDQLQVSYAMAEAVFAVSQTPLGTVVRTLEVGGARILSNGPLLDGIEVRVANGDQVGELQLRGEFVFAGYNVEAEATAAAFDGEWYRTGDIGSFVDGELYVLGRIKDVIIHHGVNYFAHDIEAVVTAIPGVKSGRCVAVAVYDPDAGSEAIEVIAECDPDDVREDAELDAAIREGVANVFPVVLANVHLRDPGWMVKTTSGKVSRAENAAKLGGAKAPAQPVSVAADDGDDLSAMVVNTIAGTFFVDAATITRNTVARDVKGWDSLGHTVLMLRLSRAVGTKIPESIAARAFNVGNLIDLLEQYRVASDG